MGIAWHLQQVHVNHVATQTISPQLLPAHPFPFADTPQGCNTSTIKHSAHSACSDCLLQLSSPHSICLGLHTSKAPR